MIKMPCGVPGSGKSYDTIVNCLLPAFKSGRVIWTNLEGLNLEYICILAGVPQSQAEDIRCLDNEEVMWFYMTAWHRHNYKDNPKKYESQGVTWDHYVKENKVDLDLSLPDGAYVIIDETQNYWGNKDFKNIPKQFDQFLSMHRHYGVDIVFITQRPARVYKEIQRLAEYVWMFEKMSWIGASSRYKATVRLGDDRKAFARHIRKYNKKYFPCYKSYSAAEIKEIKTESAVMFKPWQIAAAIIFVSLFGYKFATMRWFTGVQPNDVHASVIEQTEKTNSKVRVGGKDALKSSISNAEIGKISKKAGQDDKNRFSQAKEEKRYRKMAKKNFVIVGYGYQAAGAYVSIKGQKLFSLLSFGERFKKSVRFSRGYLVIDGKKYEAGDSFRM